MFHEWPAHLSLNDALETAGYAYDPQQDIFYSTLDPWQRKFGYCRLYDEAAAPLGMIIDCEPIYFDYGGKRWLIEFWKGQYDLTTGCEVGIYNSNRPDLDIPGIFEGTFYTAADQNEYQPMACSLKRDGRIIFLRSGLHWWLTGFRLGEFAEPSELTMEIILELKDEIMRDAFLRGLKHAGYEDSEFSVYEDTVRIVFSTPHTRQPQSRSESTDAVIQLKNKLLCNGFNELTKGCMTLQEKLSAIREKSPEILERVLRMGRPKQLYELYEQFRREG